MSFLAITDLDVRLRDSGQRLLRDVSLDVAKGQVHGLVGESGAGKSMIGKAILDVLPRSVEIAGGRITLGDTDLTALDPKARRHELGQRTALIPQDPLTALNPARRIGGQITDRLTRVLGWDKSRADARAMELLDEVQIADPARVMTSYPHELSGGMRQRVLIAAAFAAEPELIIADEPTTALDVTVQKQILKMIAAMQAAHNTTMLFVTHDLGVVARVCQRVSVLYAGHVVEDADIRTLLSVPGHPYSQALLSATPRYDDPGASLRPVPQSVIDATRAEAEARDV